jgi:ABC-2 type transport system ATP-binding protein
MDPRAARPCNHSGYARADGRLRPLFIEIGGHCCTFDCSAHLIVARSVFQVYPLRWSFMIDLLNVTQHYGVRPVLKNINLHIDRGELVVIVGPNGMGKSTLLGVMGGVLQPQHGQALIDGKRRRQSIEEEIAIRKTAVFLPDRPWLPALRTGREFLLSVARLYDVAEDRLLEHVERLLHLFDLAQQADSPIRSYSAGQQKKIALSSALVTDVPVLLLDEPFSGGLDPAGILALKRVLQWRVRRHNNTIVLTSPVPEIAEEIADRIIILREGEVLAFDTMNGLRGLAGKGHTLGEILESLIYPETLEKLRDYLEDLAL